MTDKVQKIRKEVERLREQLQNKVEESDFISGEVFIINYFLTFIDSLQEKPNAKFKVGQTITDPTDSTFTFHINKIEDGRYIEKKDEWVLVKEADANYELVEEPVSGDFEMALAEMIDNAQKRVVEPWVVAAQWKDELIELAKSEEPVSEELEEAASRYAKEEYSRKSPAILPDRCIGCYAPLICAFKAGAKWQITKLMANAIEVTVHIDAGGYPYTPEIELYDYDKDVPLAKDGDKYKVVLIKED